ncbi:uncharacterized protein TNCV_2872781 [Trichonephila clavipes]|nr:uncharacterized protein TNCV_2872781 [Trichonephila clavipes]
MPRNFEHESSKADHICQCNFTGSSSKMEIVGASRIFLRSEKNRRLHYTQYYGDGDSKAFMSVKDTYGLNSVTKFECIGHVQKRVETHKVIQYAFTGKIQVNSKNFLRRCSVTLTRFNAELKLQSSFHMAGLRPYSRSQFMLGSPAIKEPTKNQAGSGVDSFGSPIDHLGSLSEEQRTSSPTH